MTNRTMMAIVIGKMRWRADAPAAAEDEKNRLRPVGDRCECVEGQRRQALDRGDLLLGRLLCRKVPPDDDPADPPESAHRAGLRLPSTRDTRIRLYGLRRRVSRLAICGEHAGAFGPSQQLPEADRDPQAANRCRSPVHSPSLAQVPDSPGALGSTRCFTDGPPERFRWSAPCRCHKRDLSTRWTRRRTSRGDTAASIRHRGDQATRKHRWWDHSPSWLKTGPATLCRGIVLDK
jgi:hypothetical protein